jgi:hypothetical protein
MFKSLSIDNYTNCFNKANHDGDRRLICCIHQGGVGAKGNIEHSSGQDVRRIIQDRKITGSSQHSII